MRWGRTLLQAAAWRARTHLCGELRRAHVGQHVVLNGWLQNVREMGNELVFAPLRDHAGAAQLVWKAGDGAAEVRDALLSAPNQSVLSVEGVVQLRPDGQANADSQTGQVEVQLKRVVVLNRASPLPFPVGKGQQKVNEELRLKYRYLDLRRDDLQHNLRLRSRVMRAAREHLYEHGFTEIETPTLFKSTPEGAREFLVPTRRPNRFFALVQSPQQYKQLLMVGGMDRYFQFARCYRDEDARADRQLEFTQLDMEVAFLTPDEVYHIIEGLVARVWKEAKGEDLERPFPRIAFRDAIARYGSDKPDVRFGMEIADISETVATALFQPFAVARRGGQVEAFCIPRGAARLSRTQIKSLAHMATSTEKVFWCAVDAQGDNWADSSIRTPFTAQVKADICRQLNAQPNDAIIIVASPPRLNVASTLVGRLRLAAQSLLCEVDPAERARMDAQTRFLWVHEFPLFTPSEERPGAWEATHHPFTAPVPEDAHLVAGAPERVRGQHYDLVLNGVEIGGGSIRIHSADLQRTVFESVLRLTKEQTASFDHLVEALRYGAPPHGGIALGFDRVTALLCGRHSIRDVIAFPKSNFSGGEPMVESPSVVSEERLKEYHIKVVEPPAATEAECDPAE